VTDFLPYLGDVLAGIASTDAAEQRRRFDRLMQVGAQSAWDAARAQVDEELKKELGRSDRIAQGVSLYELDLRLATSVSLARAGGGSSLAGSIPMQLRIGPDLLIAKSTTPTVFGSEFDPKFSVDFGVVIDFEVDVEPERMFLGVRVGSARLTGKEFSGNPYVDSQNLIADLAKFFAGTVSPWFGGPDYVAVVESLLGQHDFAGVLNAALQPVNDLLGELAKEGMGTVMALFPDAAVPGGVVGEGCSARFRGKQWVCCLGGVGATACRCGGDQRRDPLAKHGGGAGVGAAVCWRVHVVGIGCYGCRCR
jgi:hypothetical protein